ncbi:MAG: tRNA (adenosine(37)-N6)-dimethylallyltransferase MiaA [Candidatus Cloacimonadota bacterium]|nr:MAG: tRNA (adenosine(37)-N6)-dimethylallyltransferase MiaA [Candidatus Cloacimonadota bacterium]
MKIVHVICGTTAVGKSDYAIEYAKKINGEIICLDAFQIYHSMPILSAVPKKKDKDLIKHHLYEFLDPREKFSVAQYYNDCMQKIFELLDKGIAPILVGGTMLYLNVIENGLENEGKSENLEFRLKMQEYAKEHSNIALHALLEDKDSAAFEKLHPNDIKRVIRALERTESTCEASIVRDDLKENEVSLNKVCLVGNREKLYLKIEDRIDKMIDGGILKEVENLLNLGVNESHTAFQAIGFKETSAYLKNAIDKEEWIRLFKRNTRRLAKRQLTWLRRQKNTEIIEIIL